jgi:hypothetical protein
MKLVDLNNKKALVPRTGIRNGSESGLRYQKIGRDPGFRDHTQTERHTRLTGDFVTVIFFSFYQKYRNILWWNGTKFYRNVSKCRFCQKCQLSINNTLKATFCGGMAQKSVGTRL